MINRVILVGRITKDPEMKQTQSNIAVVSFTLAVNRQFTDSSGERQADFIQCVVWRKQAENLARFVKKGSLVGVEGRIQTGSYDDKDGVRKYTTDVVAVLQQQAPAEITVTNHWRVTPRPCLEKEIKCYIW